MLQAYLGADAFQKGMCHYIQKYRFSNASTWQLWHALEHVTGEPVAEIMDTWTKQMGYPVLTAELAPGGRAVKLTQARYLSSGEAGPGQWVVPVRLLAGPEGHVASALMRGKHTEVALPAGAKDGDFIKVNVGQTGFYRVRYSEELGDRLPDAVLSGALPPVDRLGVLDDSYALSRGGLQPLGQLLHLMHAYRGEDNFSVACTLNDICHVVARTLYDVSPRHHELFLAFACSLFEDTGRRLGWEPQEGEGHVVSMKRAVVQGALVSFGHEPSVREAVQRFQRFAAGSTSAIPADLRRAAYRAAMRKCTAADPSAYDSLLKIYEESELMEEKGRVLGCLAASPDPAIVRRALDFSVSPAVRTQDSMRVVSGVAIEGRGEAWEWFKSRWGYLKETFGGGFLITRFVEAATGQFASEKMAAEVSAFFKGSDAGIPRTIQQCAERVRSSSRWVTEIGADPKVEPSLELLAAGR
mmetsp:Transcript_16953/g.53826  ORF Transcript_16953/g.53826 Transcript_16953/m.53826 type:complete len:469 (-) Transcript_16953:667-2073(-)